MIWLETRSVLDDIVAGGVDSALPDGLGDEEEVVPLRQGDHVIHHGATGRVGGHSTHPEEPGVDSLAHNDVGELDLKREPIM
jgi:hypothetical protein